MGAPWEARSPGRGAEPAPSGKRRFRLRFGPFGATSVVPPTGRGIQLLQEASPEPPSLPPGRPAAASPAAQGLLPGRPGLPPRPPRSPPRPGSPPSSIHFRTSKIFLAFRPLAQSQEYAIHLPWPLQIHHVLRRQELHNLMPGLDCTHGQTTHNRRA